MVEFDQFGQPLLFGKFSQFFLFDTDAAAEYTGAKSPAAAFVRLYRIFKRNNFNDVSKQLAFITNFHKRNLKGEGRSYTTKVKSRIALKHFNASNITRVLNRRGKVDYVVLQDSEVFKNRLGDDERIICLVKDKNNELNRSSKIITLTKSKGYYRVSLSFDTDTEYRLVKAQIEKFLRTYLDAHEFSGDTKKLQSFIKTGNSNTFEIIGANLEDDGFYISINRDPKANKAIKDSIFGKLTKGTANPENKVRTLKMRLVTSNPKIKFPLSILGIKQGILGAVFIDFVDRGLRGDQKRLIKASFEKEFGFPLNTFVVDPSYDSEEEYFRLYLQKEPKNPRSLQARSPKAIQVFKKLIENKIINDVREKVFGERFCTQCILKYELQGGTLFCSCGAPTVAGKTYEVTSIREPDTAKFILKEIQKKLAPKAEASPRTYGKLKLQTLSFDYDEVQVRILVKGTSMTGDQLQLIKLRNPAHIVLTALSNKDALVAENLLAEDLYSIMFNLDSGNHAQLENLIKKARTQMFSKVQENARVARQAILNNRFYKDKKAQGPGLFEAHISSMLQEVFGNSIWLGSTNPGKNVPDGITAVPLMDSKKGCFIWDAKYTDGDQMKTNDIKKDDLYIRLARKSVSIKKNGGLKAFFYVSNKDSAKGFKDKYLKRIGSKHFRYIALKSSQLAKIYDHFQKHSGTFTSDPKTREAFSAAFADYFYAGGRKKGQKALVVADAEIDSLLLALEKQYASLKAPTISV
jgi:hypothetical protein